jgi:hypothetical protein
MCRMLLFHGTTAKALDSILKDGLKPPQPHASQRDWVWELSGRSQGNAVFLSTAPVAGKGGDPVSFARGWPLRLTGGSPGYLIVVDLPPEARHLVHALVPNIELTSFISVWRTRSFFRETYRIEASSGEGEPLARWTLSHWCLHYWLGRYCADHNITPTSVALDAHFPIRVGNIGPALPADLTPLRWCAFLDDYFRLVDFSWRDIDSEAERERRRRKIMRHYDITLPEYIEEDPHSKHCRLCMRGLVSLVHTFHGFDDYQPLRDFLASQPKKSGLHHLPETARLTDYIVHELLPDGGLGAVQSLPLRLSAVHAHTQPFSDKDVQTFFREHEDSNAAPRSAQWTWEQWYERFPAARVRGPHVWRPNYGQQVDDAALKVPDRQVIAGAIPPRYILGAIKLTDGARFLPSLRPNRRTGETLAAKLWTRVHTLRAQYKGSPILMD